MRVARWKPSDAVGFVHVLHRACPDEWPVAYMYICCETLHVEPVNEDIDCSASTET